MNGFLDFMSGIRQQMGPQQPNPAMMPKRVPQRRNWQDTAYLLGAGLKDMGGGQGNIAQAQQMFGEREERQRLQEIRDGLPPDQQALFDISPEAWARAYGGPQEAEKPVYIEGPDGIYERGEGGWQKATSYPDAAPKPPDRIEGPDGIYERGADGKWNKVTTFGPAPRIFAPQRPAGGGGSAGGGKPWERKW